MSEMNQTMTEQTISADNERGASVLEELRGLTADEPMADSIWDSPLEWRDKAVALAAMSNCYGGVNIEDIARLTGINAEQCEGILRYHVQRLGRSQLAADFLRAYWESRSEHRFADLIIPYGKHEYLHQSEFANMLPTLMHFVSLSHYDGRDYGSDPARKFYWDCANAGFYRVVSNSDHIQMRNGLSLFQFILYSERTYSTRETTGGWGRVDAEGFKAALARPRVQNFSDYHSYREDEFRFRSGTGKTRLTQVTQFVSAAVLEEARQ